MMTNNKDIYILFGDDVRSDGENIHGVYLSLESANRDMEYWKEMRPDMVFHIEQHALYD